MAYTFEDMKVYAEAMEWARRAQRTAEGLRDKAPPLFVDNFVKAALQIPVLIARGMDRWGRTEKRNILWAARGPLCECVTLLRFLRDEGAMTDGEYREEYARLELLSKRLCALIKAIELANQEPPSVPLMAMPMR